MKTEHFHLTKTVPSQKTSQLHQLDYLLDSHRYKQRTTEQKQLINIYSFFLLKTTMDNIKKSPPAEPYRHKPVVNFINALVVRDNLLFEQGGQRLLNTTCRKAVFL